MQLDQIDDAVTLDDRAEPTGSSTTTPDRTRPSPGTRHPMSSTGASTTYGRTSTVPARSAEVASPVKRPASGEPDGRVQMPPAVADAPRGDLADQASRPRMEEEESAISR